MEELKKENICVIKDTEMTDDQKTFITSFYRNKLNGSTTPLFLNGARPLDDQTDEDIYLAIRLLRKDETGKIKEKDYAEYKHGSIIKQKIQVLLISTLIETAFNQIILRNHGSGFRKRSK